MKHNVISVKGFVRGIFTFLLTLSLTVLITCMGFGIGVFNDRAILRKVNESNYFYEVHKELNTKAEELLKQTGLPASVLTDVITFDRVYINGKYYIEDTLAGNETKIETDLIREKLNSNIDRYLMDKGINRTNDLNSGVDKLILELEHTYTEAIQLKLINYITSYKKSYMNLMKVMIPVEILLIGILSYFIIRMSRYKHRGVRQIAYAVIASSGMTILTSAYLLLTRRYEKVDASPEYYYNFIINYLKWDIKVFFYLGLMGALVAAILISLVSYLKKRIS